MKTINTPLKNLCEIISLMFLFISFQSYSQTDTIDYQLDTLSLNENDLTHYPIIDIHQHIYDDNSYQQLNQHSTGLLSPKTALEQYLNIVDEMNKNNVVLGIAGGSASACLEYHNNYPEYLNMLRYGIMLFHRDNNIWGMHNIPTNILELVQSETIGSIGELMCPFVPLAPEDSVYQVLYDLAYQYSLPVSIHTAVVPFYNEFPGYSFEYSNPASFDSILKQWPDINFNAMHAAITPLPEYNFDDDMINMLKKHDNLYCDLGMVLWMVSDVPDYVLTFINRAMSEGLEDRIMFGSDAIEYIGPITISINKLKDLDSLTVIQKKKILYWNAAKFLKLTDEEIKEHFKRIPIGIKRNLKINQNFKIYPNPTTQTLNIQLTNSYIQYPVIKIYNITGQQVLTQTINAANYSINVSNLTKGYYIISVSDATGNLVGSLSVFVY